MDFRKSFPDLQDFFQTNFFRKKDNTGEKSGNPDFFSNDKLEAHLLFLEMSKFLTAQKYHKIVLYYNK